MSLKYVLSFIVVAVASVVLTGCLKPDGAKPPAPKAEAVKAEKEHVHGEWWCAEHGVPEEICGLCNTKVAADLKAKGDWCKEHDRPGSQCFICHPEKMAEFAAQYEAKYGEKPPKVEIEGEKHDHSKEKEKS